MVYPGDLTLPFAILRLLFIFYKTTTQKPSYSHPCLLFVPQTMNKVFEHAGDLVNVKVAHNLMRLIAEGFGEDDETADTQLRSSAVCSLHIALFLYLLPNHVYYLVSQYQ